MKTEEVSDKLINKVSNIISIIKRISKIIDSFPKINVPSDMCWGTKADEIWRNAGKK